jgi:methyl-accepting chemotaxis protein
MTQQHAEANLAGWIQETIDRTTTSIESIHKSIAEVPLDLLRQSGLFEQTTEDVSDLQDRSLTAIYDTVRDVNRRFAGLASELLQQGSGESKEQRVN